MDCAGDLAGAGDARRRRRILDARIAEEAKARGIR
jgi:hypothetical protein